MIKILYRLLMFLGYSSIYEFIWLFHIQKIDETVTKKISSDASLRVKAGERDVAIYDQMNDQKDSQLRDINQNTITDSLV